MKTKLTATIMLTLFLASMLSITVTPVMAEMPPKGPHYDVNFVTGGKLAFTSTFEGTTTPTVPPLYWHDDFDDGDAEGWTPISGIWIVEAGEYSGESDGAEAWTYVDKQFSSVKQIEFRIKFLTTPSDLVGKHGGIMSFATDAVDRWLTSGYTIDWIDRLTDKGYRIYRWDGGKYTLLGILSGELVEGLWYDWKVIIAGSEIELYVDGKPLGCVTDHKPPYTSGYIGLWLYSNGQHAHFDDVTVLGQTMPSQTWIGDGPEYEETRTITGTVTPVSGGPIRGSMIIDSTSILNAVTGVGTSSGSFTFENTGGTGGFSGAISADNTNFGTLGGTFVSTESTGIYADRIVEGKFNGYFYESTAGAGYDSFHAKIIGTPAANEILVEYGGTVPGLAYVFGPDFRILDSDAGVFDGDCAVLQIPEGMIFDVYCSARGKPGGHMWWGCDHIREDVPAGKPTWHQHSPDNFDLRNFIRYFRSGKFGPQLGPYPVRSDGCTILATRWYPQPVVYPYDWIVLSLYNWYDGCAAPYDPGAYHPMTPDWYVGIMAFKASPGSLRVHVALTQGKPLKTYKVLLWYDYAMPGKGYWIIGTLTTDGSGRGSATISYSLTASTYILGIDLMWDDGTSHQQILSAGTGVLGLQNSITIP